MKLEQDLSQGTIRNNVEFVRHVENTLGVELDARHPTWKARSIEAGKLKRKRAQNPDLYSMDNLLITVDYLRRKKREVASAAAVCWFVEEALADHGPEPDPDETMRRLAQATSQALKEGDTEWYGILTRARGQGLLDRLQEWEARHGR